MNGKILNPMWIMVVVLCVLPTKSSFGQSCPGSGYAKVPKGAYSIIAEIQAKSGKREDFASRHPAIDPSRAQRPQKSRLFFPGRP